MTISKISVTRKDIARGIDTFSAKASIPEGFAEDLQNVDTNANGRLSTRTGYEGYYGWVPLRVREIRHVDTKIRFLMDEATTIDLDKVAIGPIIVQGRLSSAPGTPNDWGVTDGAHYYPTFTITSREVLTPTIPPAVNTVSKSATDHGIMSRNVWVGIAVAADQSSQSNSVILPDDVRVDTTTYDVEIDYQINAAAEAFVYFREMEAIPGQVHHEDVIAQTSVSIAVGAHQLDTFNIIVRAYDTAVNPGTQTEVIPADVTIDGAGTVVVTFLAAFTGRIYLEAVPTEQAAAGSANPGSNIIEIASPGGPFLFFSIYRFNSGTGKNEAVLVDDWSYDEATDKVTISYTLAGSAESVDIFWATGRIISNVIEVEDTGAVSATYVDSAPQLTLWGIDHAGIYRDDTARGGHVNHLDSYRRVGESRLVCGLGGNLFRAGSFEEASDAYLMGSLGVRLRRRVDGDVQLAPLFHTADPGAIRTRGVIYDALISGNYARCSAATFVSTGVVDYTLEFAAKSDTLVLGTQIDANDLLTVANLTHPQHTGSWSIISVTDVGPTSAVIRAANPQILNAKLDVLGARGRAGVFTDRITFEATPPFIANDKLLSSIPTALDCRVVAVSGTDAYVSGVTSAFALADGVLMFAERTSALLPLRDLTTGDSSVVNLVSGDMLRVSGLARRVRVNHVITGPNAAVTFTGTGSVVTGTTVSPHGLSVGQSVLLREPAGGGASGLVVVTSLPSTTEFTFAGSAVGGTAVLVGQSVELDEPLTVRDSGSSPTTFTVDGRWIPIEAPTHSYDLPPTTYQRHFDVFAYDSQPVLRSTMVSDNLYFVNQADEVMKFDGASIYRAGLPRWQLGLFAAVDTGAATSIDIGDEIDFTDGSATERSIVIASALLGEGDRVYYAAANKIWIVRTVSPVEVGGISKFKVQFTNAATGVVASGTIRRVAPYEYMLRLSLIDNNDNVIVSTEVQSSDLRIDYVDLGQIKLKLVGMPDFGIYDYARIKVDVFRSRAGGGQRFLVHSQPVDFDNFDGYILVADATQDAALSAAQADAVGIAVAEAGAEVEVGSGWDQPPRAKHVTSAAGRLVLANLVGYPELTVSLQPAAGSPDLTAANLSGKRFLIRREAEDIGTAGNMVDRLALEYRTSGAKAVSAIVTAATTFTITCVGHGAVVGDWVYLYHSTVAVGKRLTFSGWWQIAGVSGDDLTINANGLTTGASDINSAVFATAVGDIPVWLGDDGNYGQTDRGVVGTGDVKIIAAVRLADAINASMRLTDRTISGQEGFTPWLTAVAGASYPNGTIVLSQPLAATSAPSLVLPSSLTGVQVFVNDLLYSPNDVLDFVVRRLGSYAARSFKNYPELFDNPLIPDEDNSLSVIPINPADGQEITAMIPFFGTSAAGGASQLEESVVIFKTNSIYLVNVETRTVTRIDSRGLGCTAPRSVSSSKNGIVFANEAGVFMLTRSLEVVPVGQALTNLWRDTINRDQLSEATGHHYGTGRRYKLSVPVGTDSYCSEVLVYDYEREGNTFGAWTRYTNHPVVGWCNLGKNAFFASQGGDVFLVRNRGEAQDFRDEADPVAEAVITLRAEDFDLPGVRKLVTKITSLFELELSDLTNVAIATATDLSTNFAQVGEPAVTRAEYRQITLASTPASKRGTQIQVRYTHQTKDEQLVLTAVVFTVGQINETLVKQTKRFED